MANLQKPEPRAAAHGSVLDVHSIFLTIQGEGPFAGRPAIFVRLAGCNLQCPFCDTEYTEGRRYIHVNDIEAEVRRANNFSQADLVVITGGEPLRQDLSELCRELILRGYTVQIETNGVFGFGDDMRLLLETMKVQIVVSPKTKSISSQVANSAVAFKYVIAHDAVSDGDGLPTQALGHKATPTVARPPDDFTGKIYVNPMDSHDDAENKLNTQAAVTSCLRFGYTLGLQLHKYIDMP